MKILPVHISKKMLEVVPHVNRALTQFEAFAGQYNVPIYGDAGKHEYLHDLTLMLALDDLKTVTLVLLDGACEPLIEHVIDMEIEEQQAASPLLSVFKAACANDGPCAPTLPTDLPPLYGARFGVVYQGNGNVADYEDFFAIGWGEQESDDTNDGHNKEPAFSTRSHCDDPRTDAPSTALNVRTPLHLTLETTQLPDYTD